MRVGFFSDSYFPEIDGVTYTLKLWKQRLEERGHEVHIFYPGSSEYEPGKREHPVPSLPNPFYKGYNVPIPITREIPELDIVHCHTPLMMGYRGRIHAFMNNIPTVYSHHTPLEEYFEQNIPVKILADLLGKIYVPFENLFLRSFDIVTSNTSTINRGVDPVELPVGVDLDFFKPEKGSILEDLGVSNDKPVIGYSGRISIEKNVCDVAELADVLDVNIVIIGEGPKREKLEKKYGDKVIFSDFLDREMLPEFYSSIDLFVTASTGDTLGLSTLEANACGTPVVAPDVYPFNDTIQEENGERYDYGDQEDFKSKIKKCLNNEYKTRTAVRTYSLEKTIDQLEKKYRGLHQ